jgi:uroporphyrinogen-III synthase
LVPEAVAAIEAGALVLVHSPRAARHFAAVALRTGLPCDRIRLAAISPAAAASAGENWMEIVSATRPRDEALLELAAKLCKTAAFAASERTG